MFPEIAVLNVCIIIKAAAAFVAGVHLAVKCLLFHSSADTFDSKVIQSQHASSKYVSMVLCKPFYLCPPQLLRDVNRNTNTTIIYNGNVAQLSKHTSNSQAQQHMKIICRQNIIFNKKHEYEMN